MKSIFIYSLIIIITFESLYSQVEHIPIVNPIYNYLIRLESKGYLKNHSLSDLPLQKKQIQNYLKLIYENKENLNNGELSTLVIYLKEFDVIDEENAVLFYSNTDSTQVFFDQLFSNKDKYFYTVYDSETMLKVKPLLKTDSYFTDNNQFEQANSTVAQLGIRTHGSIGDLGFMLQMTNGTQISGSKELSKFRDPDLEKNVKFNFLDSDVDMTESHLRYDSDWFYAYVGREYRMLGAGINQRVLISTQAPAFDALSLGARFNKFEYKFTHASLLSIPITPNPTGFNTEIPEKYMAIHRFAFRPDWGEIAFSEVVVYSDRGPDLAYLNPLSFLKSLEHSLKDRDKSLMGLDMTIRPFDGMQVKGSFLLDDIRFEKIGTGYWSNKTAWNVSGLYSFDFPIDIGLEYSRVEPYMYTHFNVQNSYTNDSRPIGSILQPNSDQIFFKLQYWWGERYPISLAFTRTRHGRNIVDENGDIIYNAGGDILEVQEFNRDNYYVTFLDGDLLTFYNLSFSFGYEIFRNFNIQLQYDYEISNNQNQNYFRLRFNWEDF